MSTFDGYVKEFPNLAIDYFRPRALNAPTVHAYLLSHVHSDHLQGLENINFGGAFIYCTQETKELLIRIQEKANRRAARESKQKTYKYGHLRAAYRNTKDLLRVIPLNMPCKIQVGTEDLTVTLFDANHCPGSVMFLVEACNGRAVLYTGDMRADAPFLSSFLANPLMVPYTSALKRLDCIYLDTSASFGGPEYTEKALGCRKLVQAIAQYPKTTCFYFNAWCLGYEDLWLAISRAFNSLIHVDPYHFELFESCRAEPTSHKSIPASSILNILTLDGSVTRFHSCDDSLLCAGRHLESEVRIKAVNVVKKIETGMFDHVVSGLFGDADREGLLPLDSFESDENLQILGEASPEGTQNSFVYEGRSLPKILVIPYARHSSHPELARFVEALRPREVHSCTGNEGWRYHEFCGRQTSDDRIRIYEDIVRQGRWDESPWSRRQKLMDDIHL